MASRISRQTIHGDFPPRLFCGILVDAMKSDYRIIVEAGPDQGREFTPSATGGDIGRSPQNDIVLNDGELSRKHCRLEFRGDELWITDLASANGTYVNGKEVPESRLSDGDAVLIGSTTLRVKTAASVPATSPAPAAAPTAPDATVDLGFHRQDSAEVAAATETRTKKTLLWAVAVFLLLIVAAFVVKMILETPTADATQRVQAIEAPKTLAVHYTKLVADAQNVFRYELSIETNGILSVEIDDLAQSRHVRRESESPVDAKLLADLARGIEQTGVYSLSESYEGIASGNRETDYDLVVIPGADVHRIRVLNRAEPEEFRDAREKIETFVRNELGLWAIEFSTEQLQQMANDALLLGHRLMQERDIQAGNLYEATKNFRECENLLETVEPKPDFYEDALRERRECEEMLDARYKELNFNADRAIKLKEWQEAAEDLRALMQLIPDRADPRNRDAERRLLDVENRLRKK